MNLKEQLAAKDPRLSLLLAGPEVDLFLDGEVLTVRGPGQLLGYLPLQRLFETCYKVLGHGCDIQLKETPEFIPVPFPLPPLSQQDKDQFQKLKLLVSHQWSKLNSFFAGVPLLGVLPGPKLVCKAYPATKRAMLHHLNEELEELAAQVYGQPVEFIYSPVA